MPLDDYLKRSYIELQKEYDYLNEEIGFLRITEKTDELRPKERFRLQRQIVDCEKKREVVKQQLQELDRTSNSKQLYSTLLKLGYLEQVRSFIRLIQSQSVSAFLIHGSPDYGQRCSDGDLNPNRTMHHTDNGDLNPKSDKEEGNLNLLPSASCLLPSRAKPVKALFVSFIELTLIENCFRAYIKVFLLSLNRYYV